MKKPPIFLTKYVREDGTIEDTIVETHRGLIEKVQFDLADDFIRMRVDNGATDIEVRLTIENMKSLIKEFEELKAGVS